jgi:hypothetical protein
MGGRVVYVRPKVNECFADLIRSSSKRENTGL